MEVVVAGAGPAGLYAAYLLKRAQPQARITVFEASPRGATFGFGVVFSDRALEFLRAADPETADLAVPLMQSWNDITLVHRGERVVIDGVGFSAIGRLELLNFLAVRLASVGIEPKWSTPCPPLEDLAEVDLVIAADGVNSPIRRALADELGATQTQLDNRFAWFGATRSFDTLTQTFVETPDGSFNAHHYRYAPDRSTFIVECGAETWERAGFGSMDESETLARCEAIFAEALEGARLVSNRSIWRRFPFIELERWSHRNVVLIGDALRTAHFSIGSGTRLALEDAVALVAALQQRPGDVPAALAEFERSRRPIVDKLVAASRRSADWYERFGEHMALGPLEFARAYINRSGRIDEARLAKIAPRFAARLSAAGA